MSVFFIFLFLISSSFSYAAETLELIEVNATKKIEALTFTQTELLTKEELESSPIPLASQVLERVPGLISSQNGGPGGRTTFFIRGTEARHVSFTLAALKILPIKKYTRNSHSRRRTPISA
jgi:outer membrane receptor protein involved in Fe transport